MPDKVVSLALPLKESACPGICILIKHACCRDGVLGEMLFHGQIIQGYPAGTRMRLQPGADLLRAAFACGDAADDALREMPGAKERLKSGQWINDAPGRGQDDLGVECAAQLCEQRHRLCIDPGNTACTCQDRHAEDADHQSAWPAASACTAGRAAAAAAILRRSRER